MVIEEISEHNYTVLSTLFVEMWPDCDMDEAQEDVQEIGKSSNQTCYLVKEKESYIAFVHLSLRTDYVEGADTSPTAYIEGVYVQEKYRRRGIAKKLLQLAMDWGRQRGCSQLASDTELANNTSIDFHHKNGFAEAGRIVCFIKKIG